MKRANQFGKKFLSLSVACAGLLMHGMSTDKRPIWRLCTGLQRPMQAHAGAFKQVFDIASENIIPQGGIKRYYAVS